MAWYDYIPVAGSIARLAQGDYKQAGIDSIGIVGPYMQARGNAADEQKNGYLTASNQSRELGQQIANMSMQGLSKAENYFGPAQAAARP